MHSIGTVRAVVTRDIGPMVAIAWLALSLAGASGCATPAHVAQALEAKDRAYAEHLDLARDFEALAERATDRYITWHRAIRTRTLIESALELATSRVDADEVVVYRMLGVTDRMIAVVSAVRLDDLPAVIDDEGREVLPAGSATASDLLRAVPSIVRLARLDARNGDPTLETLRAQSDRTEAAFEAYRTNVAALRFVADTVRGYLDVDRSITPEDIRSIAGSIEELSR